MLTNSPRITIITATYNNATALVGCLQSVAGQKGASYEHIVIDGGSSDATLPLLEKWSDRLATWISEPDSGISEAMNKGIALARGDWLLFLHADDQLHSHNTLASVTPLLAASDADIIAFPVEFGKNPGRVLKPRGANHWLRLKTGLLHQGTFIRRPVFAHVGLHDTHLKIAMDYDLFLRAWLAGLKFKTHSSPLVAQMGDEGISSQLNWPALKQRLSEEKTVHFAHATNPLLRVGYLAYWAVYPSYKRLITAARRHRRINRAPPN